MTQNDITAAMYYTRCRVVVTGGFLLTVSLSVVLVANRRSGNNLRKSSPYLRASAVNRAGKMNKNVETQSRRGFIARIRLFRCDTNFRFFLFLCYLSFSVSSRLCGEKKYRSIT